MGYTNVRTSSNLQIEIMVGHLRNVALLCAQRSSRHKNCRICGLMLDSIIILQLQTVFYPGFKYCIFLAPTLGKRILLQTSLIIMYYTSVDTRHLEVSLSEQQAADLLLCHGTQPAGFVTVDCLSRIHAKSSPQSSPQINVSITYASHFSSQGS